MSDSASETSLTRCCTTIVAAFVSHNSVSVADVPNLVTDVRAALQALSAPAAEPAGALVPAVSVRKSVTPDSVICLDCGKRMKSLKRHLSTVHGLRPEQYRERWQLSADHPIVAPNYSAVRSRLASKIGLGRVRKAK